MPLVKLETNINLGSERENELAEKLAAIVSEEIGKPMKYVMVSISHSNILLSGESGSAALVGIMSIGGLDSRVNGNIAAAVTEILTDLPGLSSERIYITFQDVPGENWAWKGKTFR